MKIKPTGIEGFSKVYDDEGNVTMTLAYVETKEKSAKEMFEEANFKLINQDENEICYKKIGHFIEEEWVDYEITITFIINDYIGFYPNKSIVIDYKETVFDDWVQKTYVMSTRELKAINKQVEELGWNNE